MEWNEIEDKWRDKQNNKEVKPTNHAWELLSRELDNYKSKKKIPNYLKWCSIAACLFIGGYMIQVLMFSSHEDSTLKLEEPSFENTAPKVVYQVEDNIKEETNPRKDVNVNKNPMTVSKKISRVTIVDIDEHIIGEEKTLVSVDESKELVKETIEVDDMLISEDKDVRTVMIKVDSNLLLDQVEGELDMEFRESRVERIIKETKKIFVNKMK